MNRKTKSRVHELYFGTNISRKLPVGFENGSNEDRDHDLVLTRNTKCLASPHLLVFVVFPVWSQHQIMITNFNRTVLENYWEFGAKIGTKIKLVSSTFCFSVHCLSFTSLLLPYFRKTKQARSKMLTFSKSDPTWIYRKSWIKSSKFKIS